MAPLGFEPWRETRAKWLAWYLLGMVFMVSAFSIWHRFETWRDYQPAEVQVERVEHLCKVTETITKDAREETVTHDCPDVMGPGDPNERNPRIRISAGAFVTFHYLSPADGKMHLALLKRKLNDINRPVLVGDKIWVRLSRHNPLQIID